MLGSIIVSNTGVEASLIWVGLRTVKPQCRWHFSPEEFRDRQLHFRWKPLLQMRGGVVRWVVVINPWVSHSCGSGAAWVRVVFSLPAGSWPVLVLLQSMALYWLSSSLVGLCHNLLLRSPTFRRLCCIPRTKSDSDTPYRDMVAALATRYSFRKQQHWAPGRAVSGMKQCCFSEMYLFAVYLFCK